MKFPPVLALKHERVRVHLTNVHATKTIICTGLLCMDSCKSQLDSLPIIFLPKGKASYGTNLQ
jgi:hypothetical protein